MKTGGTWLVTGATGFLGRHLIEALRRIDGGARIAALVRDPGSASGLGYLAGAELVRGSPVDASAWAGDPRLDDVAGIFHLAAEVRHSRQNVAGMVRFNVDGTLSLARLAASRGWRMLLSSTSGTIGCSANPEYLPDEHAPYAFDTVARWPYYLSKIEAEQMACDIARSSGLELVVVRPPVMLGPGDHRRRSVVNVARVLDGMVPVVFHGGMHFADVRDCALAMVRAMLHPSPRRVYNLPGMISSLDAFFRLVAREAGVTPRWRVVPGRTILLAARLNSRLGSPLHVLPDPVVIEMAIRYWGMSSVYAAEIGYESRPPSETLRDTIEWLRAEPPAA